MSDIITAKNMCLWYGDHQALKNVNINIPEKSITAFIGPSGCGKSTFLKTLNRMNDLIPSVKITGDIRYEGTDIFSKEVEFRIRYIKICIYKDLYIYLLENISL